MSAESRVMGNKPGAAQGREANPLWQLSRVEKMLLLVPLLGGLVFGILPLVLPAQFAAFSGATGHDPYIYRLAGAATFGYAVALGMGVYRGNWQTLHLVIIATLAFNLASLYAIAIAIATGTANWIVYAILVASISITAITGWMLRRHARLPKPAPDIAQWAVWLIGFLTVTATAVGLTLLFAPIQVTQLFGYAGSDVFLIQQGGAATLGYGVMGMFELRSRAWEEIRLPSIMAFVFNAISLVVTILSALARESLLLPLVVFLVSTVATVGYLVLLRRQGK